MAVPGLYANHFVGINFKGISQMWTPTSFIRIHPAGSRNVMMKNVIFCLN